MAERSILLVEDNPVNQKMALLMLKKLGYRADKAANGREALAALGAKSYDLILMDVQMPGMDGLEAARRIRALPGEAGDAPIIALTANVMAHQRAAYRAAGMDGVAAKPIAPAALVAEIVRLCEARRSATRDPASALA